MSLLTNLAAYWALDGNSTDALGGHNGTDFHAAYPTGKINQGLQVGNDIDSPFIPGYVSFTALNLGAAGSPWTLSLWCKRTNAGGGLRALFGPNTSTDTFGLFSDTSGRFNFFDGSNRYSNSSVWTLNAWAHVVLTYDGTDLVFTVDGAAAGTVTVGIGAPIHWTPTKIGDAFFDSLPFPGIIDEVGVWTRVLTGPEIAALYGAGAGLAYPFTPPVPPPDVTSIGPTTGSEEGGTLITLTGTGFQDGMTVAFGGVPATAVTFVSSTKVTCRTPPGLGTVSIVVTNPDAQTDTF